MTYKLIDHLVCRRDNLIITALLFTAALFVSISVFQTYVYAQSSAADPGKEVIVRFNPGNITPPEGRTSGTPAEFKIPSAQLRAALSKWRANKMSQLIENFQPEDRFKTDRFGQVHELSDWTDVYIIELPDNAARDSLVGALSSMPEVRYAEPNGRGAADSHPNDEHFSKQWALHNTGQGIGTAGADIDAPEAWEITTGSSSVKIAIVDFGIDDDQDDFAGRLTGDTGPVSAAHGTFVAGIAAAQGDNDFLGIAGVAWNVGIIDEDVGPDPDDGDFVNAINSAVNRGAYVINNSWKLTYEDGEVGRNSFAVEQAFRDAYKMNITLVTTMGNTGEEGNILQYPAGYSELVLSVGGTTNKDEKGAYSTAGSWIDVVAPGGSNSILQNADNIISTLPGNFYGTYEGQTSWAAPIVTGIAALLYSFNPDLHNDDVMEIIKRSAEKVLAMDGDDFNDEYGYGRVNAFLALDMLQPPNVLNHWTATGGNITWLGREDFGATWLDIYYITRNVTYPEVFNTVPEVWGRGVASIGASPANWNVGFTGVVAGSETISGATLFTYTARVDATLEWFPVPPEDVVFAYTVLGYADFAPVVTSGPDMNTVGINPNEIRTVSVSAYDPEGQPLSYAWGVESRLGGRGWITGSGTSVTYHAPCPGFNKVAISASRGPLQPDPSSYSENRVRVVVSDGTLNTTVYTQWFEINGTCGGGGDPPPGGFPKGAGIPDEYSLSQNHPNPFNPETIIRFALPSGGKTTITIFDISGREVTRLVDGFMPPGYHSVTWNAENSASGLYFYRIISGGFVKTMKMTVMK